MLPARASLLLGLALAACACGATGKKKTEPELPDEKALGRPTIVKAQSVRLVLSQRWRPDAKIEGIRREKPAADVDVARGGARFALRGLRVETETLHVRWMGADHENLLLYAKHVDVFEQARERAYKSEKLSAVTMADDQVSFFK